MIHAIAMSAGQRILRFGCFNLPFYFTLPICSLRYVLVAFGTSSWHQILQDCGIITVLPKNLGRREPCTLSKVCVAHGSASDVDDDDDANVGAWIV